ncbi:SGNH/GDSL hydrolase family protein [Paraburkholderia bryophila]|uniref:Phospholipase/lecithinase/hemolysin n=1 Tax=Paraburkholderia bryophila TaxID=420952 RepID=A0A7Z0B8S3_9BURK|nr:SGNH/GDSL hydrolase family protein [Paraburkholderia bryophila]NYH13769.1 phospholipase/lecithinase/hemolysin [Paraburkholderia bryophila]NYH23737.1 phospholipase/lecithinase/hemolysin [Paraburkholderia bryophila]
MKQTTSKKQAWLRVTQIAMASTAFAMLVACGGGSDNNNNASSTPAGGVKLQVVSFGDSLSDVGTYAPVIQSSFGGGRFTTNPGEVWTQKVAEYYGGTLSAAYLGGFGKPLVAAGGFGYAQGGSDVVNPQGEGWAPNSMAATTVPVVTQVANYLSANTSFNANQLVLINGGANDIFQFAGTTANLTALATALATQYPQLVAAGQLPNTPAGQVTFIAGYLQQLPNPQIATAAAQLAAQIQTIVGSGATHVVVSTVPDIGNTPQGVQANAASPGAAALLTGITAAYNGILLQNLQARGLVGTGKVIVADAFTWLDQQLPNYQALGFTVSNTGTACNLSSMVANATAYATANPSATNGLTPAQYGSQFGSSLFCSPQTYTVAGADQTYMFADLVHPSTHLHALFAQYVTQQIAATGLGK